MKFDSTITLSIIVALAAIIVPSLTAIFNNWHDSHIKKLEFKNENEQHIREIFEEFLASYAEIVENSLGTWDQEKTDDFKQSITNLRKSTLKCLPYVSEKDYNAFWNLYDSYYMQDTDKIPRVLFKEVLPIIRQQLKEL